MSLQVFLVQHPQLDEHCVIGQILKPIINRSGKTSIWHQCDRFALIELVNLVIIFDHMPHWILLYCDLNAIKRLSLALIVKQVLFLPDQKRTQRVKHGDLINY